ncbi:MAG: polyketide cyclase, partial [Pseudomonadota bacterium]
MTLRPHISGAAVALFMSATMVHANDLETVSTFYDLLSNPGGAEETEAFRKATSAEWESIGDYSGTSKARDAFLGQMGGFAQLIPDLNWAVEEMLQDGDTVVVRSR